MTPFPLGKENTPPLRGAVPSKGVIPLGGAIPPASKAAKKAAMGEFLENYLLAAGVDEWKELTTQQQADRMESFRLFWAKHLVAG